MHVQIMVSYTTTIFTLADTNILNLDKFTCLIFGVTPFLTAFFFLIRTHLTEETEMQIKLSTNQLLWDNINTHSPNNHLHKLSPTRIFTKDDVKIKILH